MQRVSYTPPGNKTSEELINFGKNASPFFTRISETLAPKRRDVFGLVDDEEEQEENDEEKEEREDEEEAVNERSQRRALRLRPPNRTLRLRIR